MSGVLRPWLLDLAEQGLYEPVWSERIGREWCRNAARIWSIDPPLLAQEWQDMQVRFTSANVSLWATPERTMPKLKYCDPKDWHVVESAWLAKQSDPNRTVGIVTLNLKDFSRSELRQLGLDLWDPDRLLSKWHDTSGAVIENSLQEVLSALVRSGRRHAAPTQTFLKRERLFRLNKQITEQIDEQTKK